MSQEMLRLTFFEKKKKKTRKKKQSILECCCYKLLPSALQIKIIKF